MYLTILRIYLKFKNRNIKIFMAMTIITQNI
jgi:hypothetical protein